MYPILFQIGPVTIYSLGLLWALAAFAAAFIVRLELKGCRNPFFEKVFSALCKN